MKKLFSLFVAAFFLLCLQPCAEGQTKPTPPPELEKIAFLAGNWNVEFTEYSTDGTAQRKSSVTFDNQWMAGNYFLVMRSTYPDGTTGVAYMGYDTATKVYTFDEYESSGYVDHSTGTFEGDSLKWVSNRDTKSHFTMKVLSPASYSFKFESLVEGSKWKTTMDGTAKKTK
jgi:hypothetical protein